MDNRHHNPSDFDRLPDEPGRDAFEREALQREEALNEELLSAYLDGECTADEQADAEARITASPELRQLVDDLRNVRTSLEVLPQHRLEANFAERVLRRAEREVLTGDRGLTRAATAAAVEHQAPSPVVSMPPSRREQFGNTRFGSARPFLWTVAALAAAILILITNREPAIRHDPIARGPEAKYAAGDKSLDRSDAPEQNVELSTAQIGKEEAVGAKFDSIHEQSKLTESAALADDYGVNTRSDDVANRTKAILDQASPELQRSSRDQPDAPKNVREQLDTRANRARGAAEGVGAFRREPMPTDITRDQESIREDTDATMTGVQPPSAADKVRLRSQSTPMAPEDSRATPPEPAAPPRAEPAAAQPADALKAGGAADLDQSVQAPGATRPLAANGVDASIADPAFMFAVPAESLRVVEVLVSRDAWQSGAVTDVLRKNQIAVFETPPLGTLTQSASADEKANERGQIEAKRAVDFAKQQAPADGMELLVVSAPAAQVAAALDDFQNQEQFRVMKVTDASAPEQLYEQTTGALGLDRSRPGYGYGETRLSQTGQVPINRASKKELNAANEPRSGDANAQDPAGASVEKDGQGESAPADAKSTPTRPVEETETAAQPARSKRPTTTSAEAGGPGAAATETNENRQSRAARGLPVPSYGTAGGGARRFAAPVMTGGSGGKAGLAENEKAEGFGGGYGGIGYGRANLADGAITQPAAASDVPLGYGQRVMLQPVTNYGATLAGRNAVPRSRAETLASEPSPAGSLGRERVLFFFHVVDTPLPGAIDRANAAAKPAGPAEVAEPVPATKADDAKATPVPAPSSPGPTAR